MKIKLGTRLYLRPILTFSQYLLISYDPNSQVIQQLMRQLVYNIFIVDVNLHFTRNEFKTFLKCFEVARLFKIFRTCYSVIFDGRLLLILNIDVQM